MRCRTYEELDKFINQISKYRETNGTEFYIDEIFIQSASKDSQPMNGIKTYYGTGADAGKEVKLEVQMQIRYVKYFMYATTNDESNELKFESRMQGIELAPIKIGADNQPIPLSYEEKQAIEDNAVSNLIAEIKQRIKGDINFNIGKVEIK